MARTQRINLRERCTELLAENNKPCSAGRRCAPLQAVIDVFDGRRPGLSAELFFDLKTGQSKDARVVLFTRHHEFAELSYCPFCGVKINERKPSKRRAS